MSERRVFAPYGLEGGENGEKGKNLLKTKNGIVYNLGGKNAFKVDAGDIVIIMTPGLHDFVCMILMRYRWWRLWKT